MNAEVPGSATAESTSDIEAWVVRAGRKGETVAHNLSKNVTTIEWDEWDVPVLDRFPDRPSYGTYIEENFGQCTSGERQSSRDQIWRFYHEISVGDLVVLPLKNHGTDDDWVAIGRVQGQAHRDDTQPPLARNRRSVQWLARTVPKSHVEDDLRKSVHGPGTVRPIRSAQAPRRLLHLAAHGTDPGPTLGKQVVPQKPLFVLTWNPDKGRLSGRSNEQGYRERVEQSAAGERFVTRWSTGNRKHDIAAGHDVVLLLLQQGPKSGINVSGIIASGTTLGRVWTDKVGQNWVKVKWDRWVPIEDRLPRETLNEIAPWFQNRIQSSGQRLPDDQALALMSAWDAVHPPDAQSGDEAGVVAPDGTVIEGASKWVRVLSYEKDRKARERCIAEHGTTCKVCGIDFGATYGNFAEGYIHVHHKTPVHQAAADGEYKLDPINDLVPVCPNCHAMLHRHPDKPCTVEELRILIRR